MDVQNGETTPQINSIADLKPGMELRGRVAKIELYGAFVDLGVGTNGLLHISQLSTERVKNVTDIVKEGDEITVWVRSVDVEQGRIDLTQIKPREQQPQAQGQWQAQGQAQGRGGFRQVKVNDVLSGKVVRLEKFGAFVDIGTERPGMVHVKEMGSGYVDSPQDLVKIGDEIQVKVIKVNARKKQIDLSMKALEEPIVMPDDESDEPMPTAMELALRRAMQGTDMGASFEEARKQQKRQKKAERGDKRRQEQDALLNRTLQTRVK